MPNAQTITPADRNYFREGRRSTSDIWKLFNPTASDEEAAAKGMGDAYGYAAGQYTDADMARMQNILSQWGAVNPALTRMASEQTRQANTALRTGNIQDVQNLAGTAAGAMQAANPELYGAMGAYQNAAMGQLTADQAAMARAGQLTPEEVRNAQQSAREGWGARGLINSQGSVAAEVLNREAYRQQREALARQNYQQSMGNVQNAVGMQTANKFDPFSTILGQQYGMQTGNVGTNQALYGNIGGMAAGQGMNAFAANVTNPYNAYANDVYNTNLNATMAARISEANNAAALAGANTAGNASLAKNFLNTLFNVGKANKWWGS